MSKLADPAHLRALAEALRRDERPSGAEIADAASSLIASQAAEIAELNRSLHNCHDERRVAEAELCNVVELLEVERTKLDASQAYVRWSGTQFRSQLAAAEADRDEFTRFIAAYESLRRRFGDEYEVRFAECDELVKRHDEKDPTP